MNENEKAWGDVLNAASSAAEQESRANPDIVIVGSMFRFSVTASL